MDKRKRGIFIGRVVVEVMLFCLLTGCAYRATEQVLPKLDMSAKEQSPKPAPDVPLVGEASEAVVQEEEVPARKMESISVDGLFGDEIIQEMAFEEAQEKGSIVLQLDTSLEEEGLGGLLPGLGECT